MYYFFGTIKKYIIGVLSLFDDVIVQKSDQRQITVPVVFASKERLNYYIAKEFQNNRGSKVIPKMALSITGMAYDSERKSNKMSIQPITYDGATSSAQRMYNPVPYTWDLELHIITRTINDMFQVLEQVLPKFNPSISININEIPGASSSSIPVLLNSTNLEIDSELDDVAEQRYVRCTLGLQIKGNIYMPITDEKIIKTIKIDYYDMDSNLPEKYILQG